MTKITIKTGTEEDFFKRGLEIARAADRGATHLIAAVRAAAEEALLDKQPIAVSPQAYAAFLARLDMHVQPSGQLRKTMQTPTPWGARCMVEKDKK